jgi:hypothetical protein
MAAADRIAKQESSPRDLRVLLAFRSVSVGWLDSAAGLLLHASRGHCELVTAPHQERSSHRVSRRGCCRRNAEARLDLVSMVATVKRPSFPLLARELP